MFEGLMRLTGGKTLTFYANKVPGHLAKMNMLIQHAYP